MSFRSVLAGVALAAAVVSSLAPAAAGGGKRPVVVELYTSQGCNSCPPADAILGQMAGARHDVLALTFPVTYWDMLGWKDTLASEANTRRQKAYAEMMRSGGIYTPQDIVDGVDDVVGSKEQALDAAIAAREADMESVPIALSATPKELRIIVGAGRGADATIWLMHVMSKATVAVGSGENSGQRLTYRNIVRDVRAIGMWKGQQVVLDLPRNEMPGPPHDGVAVIVQEQGYGRIVGAAMLSKPEY